MTTLDSLTDDQRATVYDWLLDFPTKEVVEKVAQPAPEGFGVKTHVTTLRRFKDRRWAELAADRIQAATQLASAPESIEKLETGIQISIRHHMFQRVSSSTITDEQLAIVREMARVVRSGGAVVVDFNNRGHQDALRLPIALYQRVRGRRDQDEHYNRVDHASAMLAGCGLRVERVCGVGGYQLAAPAMLSHDMAVSLGRAQRALSPHYLAEQFVVLARKT